MKKTITLLLVLLLTTALFAGCKGKPATHSASPSPSHTSTVQPHSSPTAAPSASPSASPSAAPSQPPSDAPSASPEGGSSGSGGNSSGATGVRQWHSRFGYTVEYDEASFRASETDGGEQFAAVSATAGKPVNLSVRRFQAHTTSELEESLLLHTELERRTESIGKEAYSVSALYGVDDAGDIQLAHWYYILDCGMDRLLFETRCPLEDKDSAERLRALLDQVQLDGFTALSQLLADIHHNYEPGSAGSSLRAAALAGLVLDWYAQNRPELTSVEETASAFLSAIGAEEASSFQDKLNSVYGAAILLTEENGQELLDASGYAAKYAPWTNNDAKTVFTALLDAVEGEGGESQAA